MATTPNGRVLEVVSLFISANNLVLKGMFSSGNPNPFAALYRVDETNNARTLIGLTESKVDQAHVDWTTNFSVEYNFERNEMFQIEIFHNHGNVPTSSDTSKHTLLGKVGFVLSNLMRSPSQVLMLPLPGYERANVHVKAEIQANTRDNFVATFACTKLSNKEGFFSTSDPFLEISRLNEDNSWSIVWKNDYINSTLNPKWAQAKIPMVTLCNADIDRPLRITIWDWEKSGRHKFMGRVDTTVREMVTSNGGQLNVIEPDKQKKSSYKNSGTLSASGCYIEQNPTFSDYIAGGCELSLVVGIDFTASNGDCNSPVSLHYIDPSGRYNQYQDVIRSVGAVLQSYDSDQMYPVYGFGARMRLPDGSQTPAQHCFPIYGGGVEVHGVEGILQAYRDAVPNVIFAGPTLFAPMIQNACHIASSKGCNNTNQHYTILLIITDGVINDLEPTKAAIIQASLQPLSIIIVGVGNADFAEMEVLDSDDKLLSSNGRSAVRDIVQFVSYRDVINKGANALAQQVLAEIPTQFLQYMHQNKIAPLPRASATTEITAAHAPTS